MSNRHPLGMQYILASIPSVNMHITIDKRKYVSQLDSRFKRCPLVRHFCHPADEKEPFYIWTYYDMLCYGIGPTSDLCSILNISPKTCPCCTCYLHLGEYLYWSHSHEWTTINLILSVYTYVCIFN